MKNLLKSCIDSSFKVNTVSLFILILGIFSLTKIPINFLPLEAEDYVYVNINNYNYSVESMESEFALPFAEKFNSFAGVKEVESYVGKGWVACYIYLKNINDRAEVLEQVKAFVDPMASKLPHGFDDINYTNRWRGFNIGELAFYGFDFNSDLDRKKVKKIIKDVARINGVQEVMIDIPDRSIYVNFSESKLKSYNLDLSSVKDSLSQYLRIQTLGRVNKKSFRITVDIKTLPQNLKEIQDIVLFSKEGLSLKLSDVAEITFKNSPPNFLRISRNKIYHSSTITETPHHNVIKTTHEIKTYLKKVNSTLDENKETRLTWEQDGFISKQLKLLLNNAFVGFILVFLILYFFLGFRISAMVSLGLPLVYAASLSLMQIFSVQIDILSVTALIIVIGILVDDAIIVSEKYSSYLFEGLTPKESAFKAIKSTIFAVTGSMLTTIIAFAPIAFDQYKNKSFFYGLFIIVLLTLTASWLESYFILPNHLAHFIKTPSQRQRSRFFLATIARFKQLAKLILRFRYLIVFTLPLMLILTYLYIIRPMPKRLRGFRMHYPKTRLNIDFKKAVSLEDSRKNLEPLLAFVEKRKDLQDSFLTIGRKRVNRRRIEGEEYANINITMSPTIDYPEKALDQLKQELSDEIPKLKLKNVKSFNFVNDSQRFSEMENIIRLKLKTRSNSQLDDLLQDLNKAFTGLENVTQVIFPENTFEEGYEFVPNQQRLKDHGLSLNSVKDQLAPYLNYRNLQRLFFRGEEVYLKIGINDPFINDLEDIDRYQILNHNDVWVPISNLGKWKKIKRFKRIKQKDGETLNDVYVEVGKNSKRKILIDLLEEKLKPIRDKYPLIELELEGKSQQEKENESWVLDSMILAIIGIFFVLILTIRSFVFPVFILLSVPFGVMISLWALSLSGESLKMFNWVGLIGMAGVAVNDSLLLLDTVRENIKKYSCQTTLIVESAANRFRPIIITTITTLGGIFPMIYGIGGDAGYTKPLIFSLGWGILGATLYTLIFLPSIVKVYFEFVDFFSAGSPRRCKSKKEKSPKPTFQAHKT